MTLRYAAIIIFSLAVLASIYLFLIRPCQQEVKHLNGIKRQLQQQVEWKKRQIAKLAANTQAVGADNNINVLTGLGMLAQGSGVQIQSIAQLQEKQKIKLQLIGDYSNVYKFIHGLTLQQHMLYISDFAVKPLSSAKIQLAIELSIINELDKMISLEPSLNLQHQNIFCTNHITLNSNIAEFSLQQIRMIGFMSIADVSYAFIEFPDGTEQQIKVGDTVALEKATVTFIANNQIIFKTTNGTSVIPRESAEPIPNLQRKK